MFRNQYDGDNTTWSPQGRIHQVEYAAEAVKQGSATVGLKSKTHALLVALHRSPSELASYQKKIVKIDNHVGVSFSGWQFRRSGTELTTLFTSVQGLTSDARVLSNFMRTETMRSRMVYNRPLPITRIVSAVGEKAQINTQRYGRRPYGVGLLVAGFDESGARLFECSPTGNYFDYVAVSIGARAQSAKTYLEKHYEAFENATLDELVVHGLLAIRDTIQQEKTITTENVSIAFVGADSKFTVITGSGLQRYIDLMGDSNAPPAAPGAPAADQDVAMSS